MVHKMDYRTEELSLSDKVLDALERGMYGVPEVKQEERNVFLTTILERIYLALTYDQVVRKGIYEEAIQYLKEKKNIQMFINSELGYQTYASYIKAANKYQVPFTIVNPVKETPIGLVIASKNEAINKSDIFIKDEFYKLQND